MANRFDDSRIDQLRCRRAVLQIVVVVACVIVTITAHGIHRSQTADPAKVVSPAFGHQRIFQTRFARTPFVLNCYSGKLLNVILVTIG